MRSKAIIAIAISVAIGFGFIINQTRSQSLIHIKENNIPSYLLAFSISIFVLFSCYSFGTFLLGTRFQQSRGFLLPITIGMAGLSFTILIAGLLGVLSWQFILALLVVFFALGYRKSLQSIRLMVDVKSQSLSYLETAFVAAILFTLILCLINSLAPVTANDALVYHLNIPKVYLEKGRLERLQFNVYANMPHYGELIYTGCFAIGGESTARMFYFFVLMMTCLAIYHLCRRTSKVSAIVATSGFIVQPLLIDARVICNVDIFLALISIACIAIIVREEDPKDTFALGVLCGFAIGIKYTALGMVVGLLAAYAIRSGIRRTMLSGLIAFIVFSPWLVKNYLFVGNPLYPMFEGIFDGLNWDRIQLDQLIRWQRSMGMGRSLLNYILLPINVFIAGRPGLNYSRFDGTITPVLLILFLFSLFKPEKRTLIPPLVSFVFWALTSQQMRFLVPTLAMLAIPSAKGVEYLKEKSSRNGFVIIAIILLVIEVSSFVLPDQYGRPFISNAICDRLPAVVGLETRKMFLERMVQPFSIFSHINTNLSRDSKIFLIWENRAYYLDREYFADSFFEASTVMRWVEESGTPDLLAKRIRANGFRYVLVNNMLGQVFARLYPAESVKVLIDLISDHLRPIHSANNITLYELVERSPTGYSQEP
ncbi:MAG: ArnT family glycosyltransferase [bacterium]